MERIQKYDIAKAILIILVVIGHVERQEQFSQLRTWIYSFHIPAFFIISGILLKKEKLECNTRKFIISKAKTLLIPYFVFDILSGIVFRLCYGNEYGNIKGIVSNTILIYCNSIPDWFLPTLFFSSVTMFLVLKYLGKSFCIAIYYLSIFFMFFSTDNHYAMIAQRSFVALFFMLSGQLFFKQLANKPIYSYIALSVSLYASFMNGETGLYSCTFSNPVIFIISSFAGSIFILGISERISTTLNNTDLITFVGKNTIAILCTHYTIIKLITEITTINGTSATSSLLLFILVSITEIPIVILYSKRSTLLFKATTK